MTVNAQLRACRPCPRFLVSLGQPPDKDQPLPHRHLHPADVDQAFGEVLTLSGAGALTTAPETPSVLLLEKRDASDGRPPLRWVAHRQPPAANDLLALSLSGRGTPGADQARRIQTADSALRRLGASETSPTLLLNCLPGAAIAATLAAVFTPSAHVDVTLEMIASFGRFFDRIVVVGGPGLLERLVESREHGRDVARACAGADGNPGSGLTPRQVEVLALLAEGKPNGVIAGDLSISINTVARHVSSILTKLDARTRGEAARAALDRRLIP